MPNIGAPELIIILVIALLILGPGKLPEVGASLGKSIKEFRKASTDLQESVKVDVDTSPLPAAAPGRSGPGRDAAPVARPSAPVAEPAPRSRPPAPVALPRRRPRSCRPAGSDRDPRPRGAASDSTTVAS